MRLGIIADDFTGATDIAGFLVKNGLHTIQLNGVPHGQYKVEADAVVISLKSRSCPVDEAIRDSLAALNWLQDNDCQQFFFKYCSTFDSTSKGNIGPVTDALLAALGENFTVICPALPVNGRTIYNGYLFVNEVPLNESGMRNHPVTPMHDANLMRVMQSQAKGLAGNIAYPIIEKGEAAIREALDKLKNSGIQYAVLDALNDSHIKSLGAAVSDMKLVTGGSGLADGMAAAWSDLQGDAKLAEKQGWPIEAKTVVISGSCSQMTNAQVAAYKTQAPFYALDIDVLMKNVDYPVEVASWVNDHANHEWAPLVYATMNADDLKAVQDKYGAQKSSEAIEHFFAQLVKILAKDGFCKFIVAGGETSGSVTTALDIKGFAIGPQIAPGVPWVKSIADTKDDAKPMSLALKSGNFGSVNFFLDAQHIKPLNQ